MILEKHPLQGRKQWTFAQPSITFSTKYARRNLASGELRQQDLEASFICREGLLSSVRQALSAHLMESGQGDTPWSKRFTPRWEIAFDQEELARPGKTCMEVLIPGGNETPLEKREEFAAKLYPVANIVAGLPLLLLNTHRKPGDWHKLPPRFQPLREGRARWFGADNSLLHHPALLSVGTGLFRQAVALVSCGLAEEVLASTPQEEVEKALAEADWKAAFGLVDKARPWIQIIPGKNGAFENYPIPWTKYARGGTSYWQRFIRLHRALRRHGFEEVLEDFVQGWNLDGRSLDYSGAFSFWGEDGKLSEAHKRVMLLGKPLKRKRIVKSV